MTEATQNDYREYLNRIQREMQKIEIETHEIYERYPDCPERDEMIGKRNMDLLSLEAARNECIETMQRVLDCSPVPPITLPLV